MQEDLENLFDCTDRSFEIEDDSHHNIEDEKHGPKKYVLVIHDQTRLILYRHFTEALVRAAFLKFNHDKTKLIENAEHIFKKKFDPMVKNGQSKGKEIDKKYAHFRLILANEKNIFA